TLLPSLLPFFFQCSAPPRLLHSFPTRRSSDLAFLLRQPGQARRVGVDAVTDHPVGLEQARGVLARLPAREPLFDELDGQSAGDTDRKSTRLNSSHSQISYAVFCLKKKKKKTLR